MSREVSRTMANKECNKIWCCDCKVILVENLDLTKDGEPIRVCQGCQGALHQQCFKDEKGVCETCQNAACSGGFHPDETQSPESITVSSRWVMASGASVDAPLANRKTQSGTHVLRIVWAKTKHLFEAKFSPVKQRGHHIKC